MSSHQMLHGCEVQIQGEGPTIFMLHGWPDTLSIWDEQVKVLSPNYRCVRMTLPGYDNPNHTKRYTLDEVVSLIASIIDTVSPNEQVILMIHDWGCFYGFNYYAKFPKRVAKIIAMDIGDSSWSSKAYLRALTLSQKLMIAGYQGYLAACWALPRSIGHFLTRGFAKVAKAPTPRQKIGAHMNYPYAAIFADLRANITPKTPIDIQVPIFFAYAHYSPLPFSSQVWQESLKQNPANKVQPFDCGHWIMTEKSTEFNQAVLDWLVSPRNMN